MKKTVLITGASRGIGLALSQHFLENGYQVIGSSRTGEITAITHPHFESIALDLSSKESIQKMGYSLLQRKSKIDILINNAGVGPDLEQDFPDEITFRETFETNVTGTVFFTEIVSKHLNEGGKIINISSKMGSIEMCDFSGSVAYRMSKTALNMYSKLLANRLKGKQSVAAVHPGWVRTTISENSSLHGRLSTNESALGIFQFTESEFDTGIFWDVEYKTEIDW